MINDTEVHPVFHFYTRAVEDSFLPDRYLHDCLIAQLILMTMAVGNQSDMFNNKRVYVWFSKQNIIRTY